MTTADATPLSSPSLVEADVTAALRRSGVLGAGRVQSLSLHDLRIQGVAGRVARARITYEGASRDAPVEMIAKFPAPAGATRDLAVRLGLYEREAEFYHSLADDAGVPVPRAYGHTTDAAGLPVVLIEDLAPSVPGDLSEGCSFERAAVVVEHLARMHARWWDSPELASCTWLPRPIDAGEMLGGNALARRPWDLFRKRFRQEMPQRIIDLGDRVMPDRAIQQRLSSPPLTLIHGDLRVNNVMFNPGGSTPIRAIIDWQTAARGRGAIDVATFFVTSLTPSDRRRAEAEILPEYVAALERGGVRGFGLEQCWADYRLAVLNQFCEIVFLAAMIDVAGEVRDDVGAVTGARLMTALLDIDMAGLLPAPRRTFSLAGLRRHLHRRLPESPAPPMDVPPITGG